MVRLKHANDMDIELVTDPYACMTNIVSLLAGLGGGIIVVASRLQLVCDVRMAIDVDDHLLIC